jgi:DNA modification methylase
VTAKKPAAKPGKKAAEHAPKKAPKPRKPAPVPCVIASEVGPEDVLAVSDAPVTEFLEGATVEALGPVDAPVTRHELIMGEADTEPPPVLDQASGEAWVLYHGDTVDVARALPSASVGLSIFSPPFSSLYTFSDSPRDMSNNRDDAGFFEQFGHLVREQFRVMKPGGIVVIHCVDLICTIARDGFIGRRDFPGDILRAYEREGFVYHSRVTIWKDPVLAMQRSKSIGLLHKQLCKDSSVSRQGIGESLIVMRKPGERVPPVAHAHHDGDTFGNVNGPDAESTSASIDLWQQYASPIWATPNGTAPDGFVSLGPDINPSDTLNARIAREEQDEAHLCPLQLEVIRRCVRLWSAPGDVVWSPFAGIGSEGYVAIQERRRFVGAELKRSYWEQGVANLTRAEAPDPQVSMFAIEVTP